MKKIILSLLAPLAVFAAVVFVSPTTSQAQAANCPAGFVCTPITTPNVTPASPTPDSCPVIIIDGYRYSLNPCRISMEMIDGAGNKPFSITVNQVGGSEKSYGITRYGYGENLPMYSILGDSGVGAYGNQKINFYFNDSVLNSINSQIQSYTGRLPLHIFHSSERNDQNYLYLGIDLKVKPSQITASSSALATLSLNAASPITSTVLVTDKVNNSYSALPVLVFDIGAQNDNLLLKNVDVQIIPSTQGSTGKVNTAYLYQGSTLIASAAVRNDIASFSNIPTGAIGGDIPAHTTKGYTIKADVSGVGTGNGYTIKASVMDGGISVIGRSGILVKVVGSAKGYPITVVSSYSNGTAPQFSLASTPSISKTLLSTDPYGNASSTFMAIFNIIVSNTGSSDIVIPLPGASNLPVARAFDFSIYKNGVVYNNLPGSGNPVINGQVSYSQPSGSRLSTDGMSFVVSRNQVVTIPVVYIFQLRNVGSDSYNVGLNSINWLDVNNKFQTISYAGNPAWRTIEGGGSSNGGSGVPTASTPQFSLLSRPVISKTVSVTDQNGNSVTNYRTTYNIYVSNMSSTDINIPLANGGGILSVAKAFDFEIYKNGVIYNSMPGSGNTAINGQISYSQPTGTTLSSDRGTFVVQRNQSVTIPVMYSFQVPNAGSNSYHVGMNSINWLIPGNYFKTQSFSGNSAWRTIDEGLTSTSPSGSSVGIPTSSSTSSASAACYQFNLNLRRGDANPDVYMLQTLLIANGFDIPSVTSRLNSKGTFDADTEMAVIKYQNSKGIPATGFFGPLTRAALSASCGSPSPRPNTTPDACPVGFICNT
ncbi:MAG: peptidoglycan-binding domain-containing protein, partial [Candidatus Paceibacterota bacterium]